MGPTSCSSGSLGRILSLRLAIAQFHSPSPLLPQVSSPGPHCSFPYPPFPFPSLFSSPLSPFSVPGFLSLHSGPTWTCPLHFQSSLFPTRLPHLHRGRSFPPPHCPVWPKDRSQGETSKDKQGAVTSLSSLICHFSSSHKGQSQRGLNSGLLWRQRPQSGFAGPLCRVASSHRLGGGAAEAPGFLSKFLSSPHNLLPLSFFI